MWSPLPEKKSCHTLSAVATAKVICLVPAHALVSCPCHLVTFFYLFILTSTLLSLCPFNSFCFHLLFCFILGSLAHHVITVVHPFLYRNLHLFELWASITNSISLSVRLWMVLRFCCEMCGWGKKKSLFCAEK